MAGKPWTPKEVKILKENINKSIKELMKLLPGRTEDSIVKKKNRIDSFKDDWSKAEEEILRRLYPNTDKFEIAKLLSNRTPEAIVKKANRMKLRKNKVKKDKPEDVLDILRQTRTPIAASNIALALSIPKWKLIENIQMLEKMGYEIKKVVHGNETYYVLARYGDLDTKRIYKEVGSVNTPLLASSDWHIGSRGFSELAFKQLVEDVKKYNIKDVLVAGDVIQGKGVHAREALDLLVMNIDDQVDLAVQYLSMFPKDVTIHLTHGGHEEHLMGSVRVGYNALRHIASRVDNCIYYGYGARLSLNNKYSLIMMHTSGGLPYATSYKAERIDDSLVERADVSVFGHRHQLFTIAKPPGRLLIEGGTLQRENSFITWKGGTAQIGWSILKEYNSEMSDVVLRRPKVY